MAQPAVDDLITLLDLEAIEVNIFRGSSPASERQRVFGGQVAGQALVAAARTVEPEFAVHSLHAYFLRPGDADGADPLRGRPHPRRPLVRHPPGRGHPARPAPSSTCPRRSTCPRTGFDHQEPMPDDLPDPESLPDFREP